jgi:hypothetical protein
VIINERRKTADDDLTEAQQSHINEISLTSPLISRVIDRRAATTIKYATKAVSKTHPSWSILGSASQLVRNIFNILKWIILILFILALIFIVYKIYTWYQQRQQTANLNKWIYSQAKISEKASVSSLRMMGDDVSTEHISLLTSSGPAFQAMPFSIPRPPQSYTSSPNSATRESSTLLIGSSTSQAASSTTHKTKTTTRKNMFDY